MQANGLAQFFEVIATIIIAHFNFRNNNFHIGK